MTRRLRQPTKADVLALIAAHRPDYTPAPWLLDLVVLATRWGYARGWADATWTPHATIRAMHADGYSVRVIARRVGLAKSTVQDIVTREARR